MAFRNKKREKLDERNGDKRSVRYREREMADIPTFAMAIAFCFFPKDQLRALPNIIVQYDEAYIFIYSISCFLGYAHGNRTLIPCYQSIIIVATTYFNLHMNPICLIFINPFPRFPRNNVSPSRVC